VEPTRDVYQLVTELLPAGTVRAAAAEHDRHRRVRAGWL